MTEEHYLVVADDSESLRSDGLEGLRGATRAFRVFSNRDVAENHTRHRMGEQSLKLQEIHFNECRHMISSARDRGFAHVELDGHEIGINAFALLVEHERLE